MRKHRVIIINSNREAVMVRAHRICKSLMKNGYDVFILTWDRSGKRSKIEYIEDCKVYNFRFKLPKLQLYGVIPFYIVWWVYISYYLLKTNIDIIHPLNFYNLFPTLPIKLLRKDKIRIIYDLTDNLPSSLRWPKLIKSALSYLENFCIKFLDGIIIVDEHRKELIDTSKTKKMVTIMNSPEDNFGNLQKHDKKDNKFFTIYYGGWLARTRGLDKIIDVIKDMEGVQLIIAGAGPDEERFRALSSRYFNIQFKGLISNRESLKLTKNANAIFAFYDPKIPINRLASPNKVFEAMMCGTPIIANKEALPVAKIIEEEECGITVPYNNIEALKEAIIWLKEHPEERIKMGENGRRAYKEKYDWNIMEKRLLKLYESVSE